MYTTLIGASDLHRLLTQPAQDGVVVLDCGFDLANPQAGRQQYESGHLPGAAYVHLDETLSGAKTGSNGRHPLPERAAFARAMAALGVGPRTQVVAYDNAGGMFAARLWWLLRWIGHEAVAVLDGGQAAWQAQGYPLTSEPAAPRPAAELPVRDSLQPTLDYAQLRQALTTGERVVLDARAPDRYRGENETLDAVGGHIPGARNRFFRDNLGPDGRFLAPEQLRQAFTQQMNGRTPADVVNQCGSGVTACHNLLAMEVAGLKGAALYPGSWSEWSAQAGAPIATGPDA